MYIYIDTYIHSGLHYSLGPYMRAHTVYYAREFNGVISFICAGRLYLRIYIYDVKRASSTAHVNVYIETFRGNFGAE